jgi:hypothetical protein
MLYASNIQNPLSLNRYIYAENNPETFNDPDGHMLAFPQHYGNYNDILQVEEENIDPGIARTEEAKQQNGEWSGPNLLDTLLSHSIVIFLPLSSSPQPSILMT